MNTKKCENRERNQRMKKKLKTLKNKNKYENRERIMNKKNMKIVKEY